MDLFRLGVRAAVAYVFLLVLVRLAGKRVVYQGTPLDFVLALVLGDLVDNALWNEVPMSQFIVATSSVVFMKFAVTIQRGRGLTRTMKSLRAQ